MPEKSFPTTVKIVEVGPRDGLQNEPTFVPTAMKVELIGRLVRAGVTTIEAAAFVSPKWVPQMADGFQVLREIDRHQGVVFSALVPNLKGLEAALEAKCDEVAVFAAASETFSQKNINCSIAESIDRFAPVLERALREGVRVRGYVSCVLGCPFDGEIDPHQVALVASGLYQMGCYEISLGDTIGTGTPLNARRMIEACAKDVPVSALAGHFHDTRGMAIANVYAALQSGIAIFDSSVSGIGGCPYSPGATGNVATEDVVYLCDELGLTTGVNLPALVEAGEFISTVLGRETSSRVARAMAARRARAASSHS
ncbi:MULTISPECIES: hydroxymethylglutaryl-CoA lyase [Paraburkholderia]|uniref:hydroxymethylglutaryl-CoA lyase n=1 Tax=Paraburkholderia madseniana TaxID=2599607 RepID=A0AAP5ERI1_9BURK|nr:MULTISPECIES: hydroxymethylglutaryl-CoA lyase [Paraburkholderia]MCX4149953.1 hydroxymethylglutaryl-CoA lyase [Paraburkholderia madseniana]MDN7152889.1 hydroxymethylglutaryl-CoA lyase [Paraburkholderia sp. WS6]MDQ6411771.1 hydroxymethylglutaryl-CoA lyase [Paraburkholderia madseniana]